MQSNNNHSGWHRPVKEPFITSKRARFAAGGDRKCCPMVNNAFGAMSIFTLARPSIGQLTQNGDVRRIHCAPLNLASGEPSNAQILNHFKVTNSSADVGCIATQASRSLFFPRILTTTPHACMASETSSPMR